MKKKNAVMDEPFTAIPNKLIRSQLLDVYDKLIFITIASCNPSFPTYDAIQKWTGISRERIWKSLQKLEANRLLKRYKRGRAVEYLPYTSSLDELIDRQLVRYTNYNSSPDEPKPVRQTNAKKNKEKEQRKRTKKKRKRT